GRDIFRPYKVDRAEYIAVRDVLIPDVLSVPGEITVHELQTGYFGASQKYRAYPVVDAEGRLLNVVDRDDVRAWLKGDPDGSARVADVINRDPVVAYPEESCES